MSSLVIIVFVTEYNASQKDENGCYLIITIQNLLIRPNEFYVNCEYSNVFLISYA